MNKEVRKHFDQDAACCALFEFVMSFMVTTIIVSLLSPQNSSTSGNLVFGWVTVVILASVAVAVPAVLVTWWWVSTSWDEHTRGRELSTALWVITPSLLTAVLGALLSVWGAMLLTTVISILQK